MFEIAPVTRMVLEDALANNFHDYEDAVLYESARNVEVQGIVTRNAKDFQKGHISIYGPQELLRVIGVSN